MIPIFEPDLSGNESKYVSECMKTGWISSQGQFIKDFEDSFAKANDTKFGVTSTNCTTALHLALTALEVGPGDEVICPDLTFIAPANMIALCGAKPVLVDVQEHTWNIDPELLRAKITKNTKAILVVHVFGHAADMDPIMAIAEEHGIPVIEDNAEAPFGKYKGKMLGSIGAMSCYSFFANKILTTGEGGITLTNDENLRNRLEVLRDHGMSKEKKYVHERMGFNYRMTNMQAAVGLAQLERIESILKLRGKQEELYEKHLNAPDLLSFRPKQDWAESVHWMMTITLKKEGIRDALLHFLKRESGIDCRQMINPVHQADHFAKDYDTNEFPVSKRVSHNSLHLPSSTYLSEEQIKEISDKILNWLNDNGR